MSEKLSLEFPNKKEEISWMKKNFMYHAEHILSSLKRKNIFDNSEPTKKEKIKRLWDFVKNTHVYSYARGYRQGIEAGIIKGVIGKSLSEKKKGR